MSGERNLRRDMEPSADQMTELAQRVQLLSAQRPARTTHFVEMPTLPAYRLSPKGVKGDADG